MKGLQFDRPVTPEHMEQIRRYVEHLGYRLKPIGAGKGDDSLNLADRRAADVTPERRRELLAMCGIRA